MASHKIYTPRGFSLLEIMVVMAMFVMVAGFGMFVSMDMYRSTSYHSERDTIVSMLERARSQSISNMCIGAGCTDGKPHGVYFGTVGQYVIFQGSSYATRDTALDEVVTADDKSIVIGGITQVVFAPLSALAVTTPAGTALTITGNGRTSVITIGAEGQVGWTN